jgi:hypothetical protein
VGVISSQSVATEQEEKEGGDISGDEPEETKLEWRDYIAIAVAMLQTVLLPIIIVLAVMLALVLVLSL